jgi:hypothetical protein
VFGEQVQSRFKVRRLPRWRGQVQRKEGVVDGRGGFCFGGFCRGGSGALTWWKEVLGFVDVVAVSRSMVLVYIESRVGEWGSAAYSSALA